MQSQELPIKQTMNVILKPDTETLEEVVVLGYGSGKKIGSIVGSVAKVNSEKLSAKPVANAMDALQGQVSGLQVYTSSGEPGSSSSSYIRGVGSLTADNEPLYVLDGTPVSSSVMVMMNPNDFESVTVLKDASATSIYGSRAANGVIYITTKRGKIGEKAVITASGNYGTARLARRVSNPMNSTELLNCHMVSLNKKLMISISIRVSIPIGKITFLKMTHRLIKPTYLSKVVVIKQCIMYPVHIIFKMV